MLARSPREAMRPDLVVDLIGRMPCTKSTSGRKGFKLNRQAHSC